MFRNRATAQQPMLLQQVEQAMLWTTEQLKQAVHLQA